MGGVGGVGGISAQVLAHTHGMLRDMMLTRVKIVLGVTLLAGAVGLRNATVRRVGVPDMSTTVLTSTMTGLAARSRLAGGLVVEIGPLEEELRLRILECRVAALKSEHSGFYVPAAVISHVAHHVTQNGRDLDGAVTRLLAHNQLSGRPITVELADEVIRDLIRPSDPRRIRVEDILRIVAKHYGVSRADLLSSRRTANVVRPRQIAMYLSRQLTESSLNAIGEAFGGRDHGPRRRRHRR